MSALDRDQPFNATAKTQLFPCLRTNVRNAPAFGNSYGEDFMEAVTDFPERTEEICHEPELVKLYTSLSRSGVCNGLEVEERTKTLLNYHSIILVLPNSKCNHT